MTRTDPSAAHAIAALSVLESLILELSSHAIVARDDLLDALGDAASAHDQMAVEGAGCASGDVHRAAAELIRDQMRQLRMIQPVGRRD